MLSQVIFCSTQINPELKIGMSYIIILSVLAVGEPAICASPCFLAAIRDAVHYSRLERGKTIDFCLGMDSPLCVM